jgi:hypothetical protein
MLGDEGGSPPAVMAKGDPGCAAALPAAPTGDFGTWRAEHTGKENQGVSARGCEREDDRK